MKPTDRELLEAMVEILRPFARKYATSPAFQQMNLSESVPVRMDYLRDAYLMLYKYDQVRKGEKNGQT